MGTARGSSAVAVLVLIKSLCIKCAWNAKNCVQKSILQNSISETELVEAKRRQAQIGLANTLKNSVTTVMAMTDLTHDGRKFARL